MTEDKTRHIIIVDAEERIDEVYSAREFDGIILERLNLEDLSKDEMDNLVAAMQEMMKYVLEE